MTAAILADTTRGEYIVVDGSSSDKVRFKLSLTRGM
jgi:hypothetical protein